jgi:hypothetical protein
MLFESREHPGKSKHDRAVAERKPACGTSDFVERAHSGEAKDPRFFRRILQFPISLRHPLLAFQNRLDSRDSERAAHAGFRALMPSTLHTTAGGKASFQVTMEPYAKPSSYGKAADTRAVRLFGAV